VYHITKNEGLSKGIFAFKYRFQNCRSDFHIFENSIDGRKMMILPNKEIIEESEISARFLIPNKD